MSVELDAAMTAEEVISVLQTIQKVTGTGGALTAEALAALDSCLTHVISGLKGNVDTVTVIAQVEALTTNLKSDDDTADAALAKKV